MKRVIFFDFDGTIVDSKAAYYDAIGDVLKKFGFGSVDVEKAIDMGFSLRKTLYKLGFGKLAAWTIKKQIMKKVKANVDKVRKCKDISDLKNIGGKKILVTNSLKEFVLPVVRHLKLKKYFDKIYGADAFYDKGDFLKDYIKKKNLDKENCFYVGDRVADISVAKKIGCKSVIISGKCSWDSRKELLNAKPDFLISGLGDLAEVFEK